MHVVAQIAYSKELDTASTPVISTTTSLSGAIQFAMGSKGNLFISCPDQYMAAHTVDRSRRVAETVYQQWGPFLAHKTMHKTTKGEAYERFKRDDDSPDIPHLLRYTRQWGPLLQEVVVPRTAFVEGGLKIIPYGTLARLPGMWELYKAVSKLWQDMNRDLKDAIYNWERGMPEADAQVRREIRDYHEKARILDLEAEDILRRGKVVDIVQLERHCEAKRRAAGSRNVRKWIH
jgi:hypothetical protein